MLNSEQARGRPLVLFVNGYTGAGKTTALEYFKSAFHGSGLRVLIQNEFELLQQWAKQNEGNTELVSWRDNELGVYDFFLELRAYVESSIYIAQQSALQVLYTMGEYDIVLHESARGAGVGSHDSGTRDRYDAHLFRIFFDTLAQQNVAFANLEIVIESMHIRQQRAGVIDRVGGPPQIIGRYLDAHGQAQSAVQQAADFSMVVNKRITNDGELTQLHDKLTEIVRAILTGRGIEHAATT